MSFKELQKQVDDWAKQWDPPYWAPHQIYARLGEEVGEVGREINHLFGPKPKKPDEETKELGIEISDVFFTLFCLANSLKIDLDEAFERMMEKYNTRDANRYKKKNK